MEATQIFHEQIWTLKLFHTSPHNSFDTVNHFVKVGGVMNKIDQIIQRLEAIAKLNGDSFRYSIEIRPGKTIGYLLECKEEADGHVFVDGSGATIEAAVDNAGLSIPAALKEWGYLHA